MAASTTLYHFGIAELAILQKVHLLLTGHIVCTSHCAPLFHVHSHDNFLHEVGVVIDVNIGLSIMGFVDSAKL